MSDLVQRLRRLFCLHEFRGIDLQPRDAAGMVTWPCAKCGKVYREPYGVLMASHGTITGPWSGSMKKESAT
jgi:hypothetical protein